VLFTVLGSTLMLIGILALVQASGTASLDALAASAERDWNGIPRSSSRRCSWWG